MIRRAPQWNSAAGVWARAVLQRRPVRLVTVALANKMARVAWALMTRKQVYRATGRVAAAAGATGQTIAAVVPAQNGLSSSSQKAT
jgi:transposase